MARGGVVTCPHCRDGHWRSAGLDGILWHYRITHESPRGSLIGRCEAPDEDPARARRAELAEQVRAQAAKCAERLGEVVDTARAIDVLAAPRHAVARFTERSQPREPWFDDGEDDA